LPNLIDESIEESFVPKVPINILGEAVSFFRHIYNKMKAESFVQVIYNPTIKEYYIFCPPQKVCATGVDWEIPDGEKEPEGIKVLELHSHCDMDSFFSGIDDADEKADRYYGVIGKLDNFMPEISFRLVLGGDEYEVEVEDIFDLDGDVYHSEFPQEWAEKVTKAPVKIISSNNKNFGKTYVAKSPASLPDDLKEYDFNDDNFEDEEALELTDEQMDLYADYLKNYRDYDRHTDDENPLTGLPRKDGNSYLMGDHMSMGRRYDDITKF